MAFARASSHFRSVLATALLCSCGGCTGVLSDLIANAPNRGRPAPSTQSSVLAQRVLGVDRQMIVHVGPPAAALSVWVLEPEGAQAPRGTVLVIHGHGDGKFWMLGQARHLAECGYRAVLVDLRGQGTSSGEHLTFGVLEKRDLMQVIDALQRAGLASERLGVWGMSYGAAMAIQLAGHDPRVKAVVAVAGFTSVRDVAPHFMRMMLPGIGWLISERDYQSAIDEAGRKAGYDPDRASALAAIRQTHARILLVHGTADWLVPFEHSRRLHAASPPHSSLLPVPGAGHVAVWFDLDGRVAQHSAAWFDRWLARPRSD